MTRDFSKNLTIMVAGSGPATMAHLEASLAEWIFGPVVEREVHVILPLFSDMGGAIRNLIKLGMEWEFRFTVIQSANAPMTRELSALSEGSFVHVDTEREALEHGLELLTQHHKQDYETAFIMAYNPKSVYEQGNLALSDLEIIGDVKNYQWLPTLNLCEGLVDSFEGFETTDELLKRERLQKEFDEKQKAEEATKPVEEKKAPTPRKRAAKKAVAPEPTKPLAVAEKPLQDVPVGTVVEVAGMAFTKKGPNPFRDPIPGNPVHDDKRNELSANVAVVIGAPDIQEDIREAHGVVVKLDKIAVSRNDLADLSQNIRALTEAFGGVMDTFTRILKDG